MKPQYQHNVTTSFALWFDHYLLEKGEAYSNQTGTFTYYADPRISTTYKAFGTPYKQFVYDSTITGASIPSGVHVSGVFKGRNDGVIIDYINGRALISGVSAGVPVTGSFAVKDFNIYLTNENEDDLILDNNLDFNKKFPWTGKYIPPYDQVAPAVFIANDSTYNSPFSFGGEDESRSFVKCVVFTDNPYQLDGILSIFTDSKSTSFKHKDFTGYPLTEYGDVKNQTYSYDSSATNQNDFFIDEVVCSKLKDSRARGGNAKPYIGFIDFEVVKYRYPRS
jgi:hypothetical protein